MMKAHKMLVLLLVMLLDSSCIIEANYAVSANSVSVSVSNSVFASNSASYAHSTAVDDRNDDGSGFEDDDDSGNFVFHQI